MGQQQLLLLVLSVIIVALAMIVGIKAFRENSVRSNADVLVHDAIEIGKSAIVWKEKAHQFGGQEPGACRYDPSCFGGINFRKLGYKEKGNPFRFENPNGEFHIVERKDAYGLKACNRDYGNTFIVEFRGIDPDSIVLVQKAIGVDYKCSG